MERHNHPSNLGADRVFMYSGLVFHNNLKVFSRPVICFLNKVGTTEDVFCGCCLLCHGYWQLGVQHASNPGSGRILGFTIEIMKRENCCVFL